MKNSDRRNSTRVSYTTPVRLMVEGEVWSGRIEDFSTTGVLIFLDDTSGKRLPRIHSLGSIVFQIDGVDHETAVEVTRSSPKRCGLTFRHPR